MPAAILLSLFVLTKLLFLINPGIFWDDWFVAVLAEHAPQKLITDFYSSGFPLAGYLHVFLREIAPPPFIYRCIWGMISIGIIVSYISVYKSLGQDFKDAVAIGCLALVLPFNFVGFTMIMLPTALCWLSFMTSLAIFLSLDRTASFRLRVFKRVSILIFLFISLFRLSHVPMVAFFYLCFAFQHRRVLANREFRDFLAKVGKHLDIALVTVGFLILRNVFFPTGKEYSTYYMVEVSPQTAWTILTLVPKYFAEVGKVLWREVTNSSGFLYFFLAIWLSAGYFLRKKLNPRFSSRDGWLLVLSILGCSLSFMAFAALGREVVFGNWQDRYNYSAGFFIAPLVYISLKALVSSAARVRQTAFAACLLLILGVLTLHQIRSGKMWLDDALKQKAVLDQIRLYFKDQPPQENALIEINDHSLKYADNRDLRFYEYSGLINFALNRRDIVAYSAKGGAVGDFVPAIKMFIDLGFFERAGSCGQSLSLVLAEGEANDQIVISEDKESEPQLKCSSLD